MIFDVHNHVGIEIANYRSGALPYAQTIEDLEMKIRRTAVTHSLVFPFVSYPRESTPTDLCPPTSTLDGAVPYASANRALLEEIELMRGLVQTAFLPVAILDPSRQPEEQVRTLRELHAKHPFVALKIQGTIIQSKVTSLLNVGRCFLDFAKEEGLPFVIHSSVLPSDIWSQAHDIIDVAEQNPDIRFMVAHSCRFQKSALDRIAALPNTWFDCSAHRIHCQLAEKNVPAIALHPDRFETDYSDPSRVLRDLTLHYPGKLIWGTDSPYYSWIAAIDGRKEKLLSSYDEEWKCVTDLPSDLQIEITQTNPKAWLYHE